jgi:alpha-beta hydrolase superfamily lysophospholipase
MITSSNPESTLSTFIASNGDNVVIQDWPLAHDVPLRGVVIIVHGLGEHAGRYDHVAQKLNAWGYAVRGYDQCGHGESAGPRGGIPTDTRLLDDLADIIDSTRARMDKRTPLILIGHSMGGLVAGHFVSRGIRPVDALVMSSPALNPGLGPFQKLLLAVLPRIAPDLRVGNGVKPHYISHDPAVVAAYKSDTLVHDRISARLARYIAQAGPETVARAPDWKVPTLLMYAGQDHLLNAQGSRDFANAAPPDLVTSMCFEALYHEIFNELDSAPVFEMLQKWLEARF